MEDAWERKNVLMVVKTYPAPSKKYQEIVCTAGITEEGKWIRLYPVQFRQLAYDKQFKKFSWINLKVRRNTKDFRPESHYPDMDTIKVVTMLDSKHVVERKKILLSLCKKSLEEISDDYNANKVSIAIFKPKEIIDFIVEEDDREWSQAQIQKLNQISLFDSENTKTLQKVPFKFSYKFKCNDDRCKGHKIMITDWEIYQLYRNCKAKYRSSKIAIEKVKEKYLDYLWRGTRESYFIVGTTFPYDSFIIVGIFHFKRDDQDDTVEQISFFD